MVQVSFERQFQTDWALKEAIFLEQSVMTILALITYYVRKSSQEVKSSQQNTPSLLLLHQDQNCVRKSSQVSRIHPAGCFVHLLLQSFIWVYSQRCYLYDPVVGWPLTATPIQIFLWLRWSWAKNKWAESSQLSQLDIIIVRFKILWKRNVQEVTQS